MLGHVRHFVAEASIRVTLWLLMADTVVARRWPWAFGIVARLRATVRVLKVLWALVGAFRALLWVLEHIGMLV